MTKKVVTVSVILTSFNHAKYLRESIDSVLNQTYSDFELIIWDDASDDGSWEIISQYTDKRIKAFRNDRRRRGVYGINKAISEVASGKYIAIHHSDDVWESRKLELQVQFLDESANSNVGAVFTNALAIGEEGGALPPGSHFYTDVFDQPNRSRHQWLRFFFTNANALCHPSVLIRKVCYEECGLYRFGFAQAGDFEMWVRLVLRHEIHVIPEKLVRFRVRDNDANASASRPEARYRFFLEYFWILQNYLSIKNIDDLERVFPESRKYCNGSHPNVKYALAMATLEVGAHNFAALFSLTALFSIINNESDQEGVAFDGLALSKLIASFDPFQLRRVEELTDLICQRDGEIERLNQAIGARDAQVAGLSQAIGDRDRQISGLNEAIGERDQQISGLSEAIGERDRQVTILNQAIGERDGRICGLSQAISELDRQLSGLRHASSERDAQIAVLKEAVAERDAQIIGLNHGIGQRDGQILMLKEAVAERDAQIIGLNHGVGELKRQIDDLNQNIERLAAKTDKDRRSVVSQILDVLRKN